MDVVVNLSISIVVLKSCTSILLLTTAFKIGEGEMPSCDSRRSEHLVGTNSKPHSMPIHMLLLPGPLHLPRTAAVVIGRFELQLRTPKKLASCVRGLRAIESYMGIRLSNPPEYGLDKRTPQG